jgi:hypothetical protein
MFPERVCAVTHRSVIWAPILLVVAQTSSAAINAPYITSVTALGSSVIFVQWRNNSFDAKGFIVQRSSGVSSPFKVIDSVPSGILSLNDSLLQPSANYCYRMFAYGDSGVSDSSNTVCATTLAADTTLNYPILFLALDTSHFFANCSITNLSIGATGYRLFRRASLSDTFALLAKFTNADSKAGTITFTDSTVAKENRYYYNLEVYNATHSVIDSSNSIFIYVPPTLDTIKFNLLGRIPLSGFTGWARIVNDSVFFEENPSGSPAGNRQRSIMGTADPSNPSYLGPASDSIIRKYNSLYGIIDTGFVVYRAFPFMYWAGHNLFYESVFNKDHYNILDSFPLPFAITSRFVICQVSRSISRYFAYYYAAVAGKYGRLNPDTLPNAPDNWTIGDSNFILAAQSSVYFSKWNVYSISDDGKNLVFRHSTIWPYKRLDSDFTSADVNRRIFFFFPYFFQINITVDTLYKQVLEVADMRQADTCKVIGQLDLVNSNKEPANCVLFDTKRNLVMTFYPSEMNVFSISKPIAAHMGVPPSAGVIKTKDHRYLSAVSPRWTIRNKKLQITMPNSTMAYDVSLMTVSGRVVEASRNIMARTVELKVGNLSRGVYFLSVKSREARYAEKVFVQ